jgi:hypothetical protein
MKKLIFLIVGLAIVSGLVYYALTLQPKPNETQTSNLPGISEDTSLTTIDSELNSTEVPDFDQEIQALDQSINQL